MFISNASLDDTACTAITSLVFDNYYAVHLSYNA